MTRRLKTSRRRQAPRNYPQAPTAIPPASTTSTRARAVMTPLVLTTAAYRCLRRRHSTSTSQDRAAISTAARWRQGRAPTRAAVHAVRHTGNFPARAIITSATRTAQLAAVPGPRKKIRVKLRVKVIKRTETANLGGCDHCGWCGEFNPPPTPTPTAPCGSSPVACLDLTDFVFLYSLKLEITVTVWMTKSPHAMTVGFSRRCARIVRSRL